eukprot:Pgem_evm1s804
MIPICNNITELPVECGNWVELKSLTCNSITELPVECGNWVKLESFTCVLPNCQYSV